MAEAFIYDAVRSPRTKGKSSGALHVVKPVDLLAQVLKQLALRNAFNTTELDDVVMGCVTQTGDQGACIARSAALLAGYDLDVSGVTLNRFCGSGLEAINQAATMVASGFFQAVVAGGVESMSRVKMGSDGGAMFDPELQWKTGTVPQGISADLIASKYGFSRQLADEFAVTSQKRAGLSQQAGFFNKSVVSIRDEAGLVIAERDDYLRPNTTLETLSQLRPSFATMGEQFGFDAVAKYHYPELETIHHIHHAGNSSGIVDGAAAVLVANRDFGDKTGLKPRAKIKAMALAGDDPVIMLRGPLPATTKALKQAKMTIKDIDVFEVNEAFAAVPLLFMQHFGVDHERVNIDGGAIALGHPLGATGAMLLNTALDILERNGKQTALITLCIGGGMGITTVIERV